MKKTVLNMAIAAAAVAAICSCSINIEPEQASAINPADVITVTVGQEATKVTFTDSETFKWSVGDQICWVSKENTTATGFTLSDPLTADQITNDGYCASFTIAIPGVSEADQEGFFTYGFATQTNSTSTDTTQEAVQFSGGKAGNSLKFTQSEAGVMNPAYIHLHSGMGCVTIAKGTTSYSFKPKVAGSILRIIPYTTTKNDESVECVSIQADSLVATARYNHAEGTYEGNASAFYSFVKMTLTTPFSLAEANSVANSKGIYVAIPASGGTGEKALKALKGLKIVITTDKDTYTYDLKDNYVIKDATMKNLPLLLDADHGAASGGTKVLATWNMANADIDIDQFAALQPDWIGSKAEGTKAVINAVDGLGTAQWVCAAAADAPEDYAPKYLYSYNSKNPAAYTVAVKGIWTGDGFVFTVKDPVSVKAGSKLQFYTGMYLGNSPGPCYWNVDYSVDGGQTWVTGESKFYTNSGAEYSYIYTQTNWTDVHSSATIASAASNAQVVVKLYLADGTKGVKDKKVVARNASDHAARFVSTQRVPGTTQYNGPTIVLVQ